MRRNAKQFELLADSALERKSKRTALFAEIRRQVKRVKVEAHCQNVPTDLNLLAKHLEVTDIQTVPLPMRGRLLLDDGDTIIQINSSLSDFDKFHTIAHELSHLIIERNNIQHIPQRADRAQSEVGLPQTLIETLCDEAAAEIILPRQWLRERVKNTMPSLPLLLSLASESKSSPAYIANQIIKEGLWGKCKFVWWRNDGRKMMALKAVPELSSSTLAWLEPIDYNASIFLKCLKKKAFLKGKETLMLREDKLINKVQCMPISPTDIISLLY